MKRFTIVIALVIITAANILAQQGNKKFNKQNISIGHFYGKVLDAKTNKPIAATTVQLLGNKFDTVTKQRKQVILKTIIGANNGDFSLENVPLFGNFILKISSIGYKTYQQPVSFGIKMPANNGSQDQTAAMQQLLSQADKDLGNIKLETDATDLAGVTVTSAEKPLFEMDIDKKVFNVEKDIVSTGQTATEIMKSIPSVNVDIDGNVTLRNATPIIFIDGRPTTLTLDEIPSDIIDKVEIITNPSAKYDASGGNAGIINIILKKNKQVGYNGGIRTGVDTRGRYNLGGDLNVRENKINFFATANYMERKSKATSSTDRTSYLGGDTSFVYNNGNTTTTGGFGLFRGGFDYFMDNRNTITATGIYNKGQFSNNQPQVIDSTISKVFTSYSNVNTNSNVNFENIGSQLSFKHNFQKEGTDLTADANYNSSTNNSNSFIADNTFTAANNPKSSLLQKTIGSGYSHYFTFQSDYENSINESTKFETGVRAAIRDFRNDNDQYADPTGTGNNYQLISSISSKYTFTDQVYAAYASYKFKVKKWGFLLGLRAESSNYNASLIGTDSSFKTSYPLSLFPSAFITYKLNYTQDFQINYSRRINRPNFFQLMPFPNYSDPQNISIGNAGLRPEFTNSFEASYNNAYKKGANFLATVYVKYSTDLITRYTYLGKNAITGDSAYFFSYINANYGISYGLELTDKMPLTPWWDVMANINFFNSQLNATLPNQNVNSSMLSWFGKLNNTFKIAKGFSFQLSGSYFAKTVLPQNSGSGGGGGSTMYGNSTQTTAQGYIYPRYEVEGAIKKDWVFKNGKSASLTLSMNDIFRTLTYDTHSEGVGFVQDNYRRRDPQVVRLNFNYRFGKFDASLFKRKNTKTDNQEGIDMAPASDK